MKILSALSHSTDSVKRNGISKKKRGITLPTVAKLKGRVNFAAHKGLLNDFFYVRTYTIHLSTVELDD